MRILSFKADVVNIKSKASDSELTSYISSASSFTNQTGASSKEAMEYRQVCSEAICSVASLWFEKPSNGILLQVFVSGHVSEEIC